MVSQMGTSARRLPPWKEVPFFNVPTQVNTAISAANKWFLVAPADTNRVVLFLSSSVANMFLTIDPTVPTGTGMIISDLMLPFEITEARHGPLCTAAWYASMSGVVPNAAVAAVSVVLREWPPQFG